MDDSFDDTRTLAQLAGSAVEVFAARTGAVEHLRRGDVVDRAAQIPRGVRMQVAERRILLTGLVVGQRLIHDRVLRDLPAPDILEHVVQRARDIENDALPPEFPFRNCLPVTAEAFVASALCPYSVGRLGLFARGHAELDASGLERGTTAEVSRANGR